MIVPSVPTGRHFSAVNQSSVALTRTLHRQDGISGKPITLPIPMTLALRSIGKALFGLKPGCHDAMMHYALKRHRSSTRSYVCEGSCRNKCCLCGYFGLCPNVQALAHCILLCILPLYCVYFHMRSWRVTCFFNSCEGISECCLCGSSGLCP